MQTTSTEDVNMILLTNESDNNKDIIFTYVHVHILTESVCMSVHFS